MDGLLRSNQPFTLSGVWVSILSIILLTRIIVSFPDWAHKWRTGYWGVKATLCLANIGFSFSSKVLRNAVVPAYGQEQSNIKFLNQDDNIKKLPADWLFHTDPEWTSFWSNFWYFPVVKLLLFRLLESTASSGRSCQILPFSSWNLVKKERSGARWSALTFFKR